MKITLRESVEARHAGSVGKWLASIDSIGSKFIKTAGLIELPGAFRGLNMVDRLIDVFQSIFVFFGVMTHNNARIVATFLEGHHVYTQSLHSTLNVVIFVSAFNAIVVEFTHTAPDEALYPSLEFEVVHISVEFACCGVLVLPELSCDLV